jgi:hypothetical protein
MQELQRGVPWEAFPKQLDSLQVAGRRDKPRWDGVLSKKWYKQDPVGSPRNGNSHEPGCGTEPVSGGSAGSGRACLGGSGHGVKELENESK